MRSEVKVVEEELEAKLSKLRSSASKNMERAVEELLKLVVSSAGGG